MNEELRRLSAQLRALPGERDLRSVFADALIREGGDAAVRGEIIQLELASNFDPENKTRADALAHSRKRRGFPGRGEGFARTWTCAVDDVVARAEQVFVEEPYLDWLFVEVRPEVEAIPAMVKLVGVPELAHLRQLAICFVGIDRGRLGAAGVEALLASPYWPRLEALELHTCDLGDAGARVLAGSTKLGGLRVLDLSYNEIGADGVIALAGSFAGLRSLCLDGNRPGARGLEALASPENRMELARLMLARTEVRSEELEPLRQRFPTIDIVYDKPPTEPDPEPDDDTFTKGPFV